MWVSDTVLVQAWKQNTSITVVPNSIGVLAFLPVWYDFVGKRTWCRVFESRSSLGRAGWWDFAWPCGCLLTWAVRVGGTLHGLVVVWLAGWHELAGSLRWLAGHGSAWTHVIPPYTRKSFFAQIRYSGDWGSTSWRVCVVLYNTFAPMRGLKIPLIKVVQNWVGGLAG